MKKFTGIINESGRLFVEHNLNDWDIASVQVYVDNAATSVDWGIADANHIWVEVDDLAYDDAYSIRVVVTA